MNHDEQVVMINRLLKLRKKGHDEKMLDAIVRIPITKYTDRDLYYQELTSVFARFPLIAGHVSAIAKVGSFITSDWDEFPYVVTRGNDGRLHAFYNQCCHRGARLIEQDRGFARKFVCPYHGWTYELDGKLRGIPRSEDFPGINKSDYGLVELPVTEAAGLIWVGRSRSVDLDIPKFMGNFYSDLLDFDVASLVQYKKTKVIKEANWKLLIQTYLEGYHVPVLHRDTLALSFKNGVIAHDEYGPHIRLSAARTNAGEAELKDPHEWRILDFASVYYSLFPNTFFIFHPDYVSINTFWPLAPDRTVWTHEMLYHPDDFIGPEGESALEKRFNFTNNIVFDQEDFAIAEKVQKGFRSGVNDHHLLGLAEGLLAIFQENIDTRLIRS